MTRLTEAQMAQLQRLPLPVRVPGPEPWELDGNPGFWVVTEGQVEVFAQTAEPGRPEGHRRHLFTFQPGEVVAGLRFPDGFEGLRVIAVAGPDCRLLAGQLGDLQGPAQADLRNLLMAAFLQAVMTGAARNLLAEGQPELAAVLAPGASTVLAPEASAATLAAMGLVRIQEGAVHLLGDPACLLEAGQGALPLAKGLWLQADAHGATLECLAAGELPDWAPWGPALEPILACLMAGEGRRCLKLDRERLARMAHKADAELERRHRSLVALATLTAPKPASEPPQAGAGAVLDACRMVGRHSGISFLEPPQWIQQDRTRDPLAAICRVSRVRLRRVALRGAWWARDAGALLGFLGEARIPVALLPKGRDGGYLVQEHPEAEPRVLAPEQASQLDPFAYTFYRPAPSGRMTGRDLIHLTWHDIRGDLGWVLAMALIGGLVGLALPVTLGLMMSTVIPQANPSAAGVLFLALAGLILGNGLFDLSRGWALLRVEGRAAMTLQAALVDRLLTLPVNFFRAYSVGDLTLRTTAVEQAHALLSGAVVTSLLSAIFSCFNLGLLFYYDRGLAWVGLGLVVLVALFNAVAIGSLIRLEESRQASAGALSGMVFQLLNGISKLRVAAAEGRAFAVWCEALWTDKRLEARQQSRQLVLRVFNEVLPILAMLAIFGALALFLGGPEAKLHPADFIAFNSAFGTLIGSAASLSGAVMSLQQIKPIFERARPILETVPEEDLAKPDPGQLKGRIEANHLSFRYRADGPQILQDVSFRADPGEFIAFVGPSGCGKSTTLRLLLGFEQPETGAIYYDRQDLSAVDVGSLRSQIGVVLQSSRLLGGSIWQNIVGSSTLTLDDAWAAAEAAGFADDVRDMPMGMHTMVSEGGGTLSGGQRQRLLIARALVRRPRIILFDEATSALDNSTQAIVSASLERTNATRIVIAHRLSTIQRADRIYVMEKGRVVQVGRFESLSVQNGLFRELAQRQVA